MAKTNDSQEEKRKKREEWSLPFALPALRSNHGLVGRTGRSLIPLGIPNLQWVAQLNAGDATCSNGGRTGRYSKPNISAALRLQCTRARAPAGFKDTSYFKYSAPHRKLQGGARRRAGRGGSRVLRFGLEFKLAISHSGKRRLFVHSFSN